MDGLTFSCIKTVEKLLQIHGSYIGACYVYVIKSYKL